MHIYKTYTVSLPAVLVAVGIIIGWALANEYIHVAMSYWNGLSVPWVVPDMSYWNTFEAGVILIGAVCIGAAACIIVMGIKKKD